MAGLHISKRKQECPKCGYSVIGNKLRKSTTEFIENAIKKHGNKYDYSKIEYIDRHTKVLITCNLHGDFMQTSKDHLNGSGCRKCGNINSSNKIRSTTEKFIERANNVHKGKYDYFKVEYVDIYTKVIIICPQHGDFEQTPTLHLANHGCLKCGAISAAEKNRLSFDEFIERATQIHQDKYDYSKVNYIDTHTKIIIICPHHSDFLQTPASHFVGSNCPKCNLCPTCQLWQTRGKLCEYCEPSSKHKKYVKSKEYAVVKFLKEKLPDYEFIHNKSVGAECTETHLFPDIRYDCGTYHLIVEIDEHQHRGANYDCDKKRMHDIIAKLGLPCIFIRYNPDNKNSDLNMLLEMVKKYLELDTNKEKIWDDFGFFWLLCRVFVL
jgi:hypothetical protein